MRLARLLICAFALLNLFGCQSLREQMLAVNYPPAFVEGFEAGCSSGRSVAGPLGQFDKNVPRYMSEPLYAQGWEDGFRQCQGGQRLDDWQARQRDHWRDEEWRHHVGQAMAKALRR
ncbi:hypothetical protein N7333_06310 [Pseudomonas sp. GD04158]|jgi:hypothetical protein|uniref:hypothetical protein n=1 Tax=Pseudomonadaceae TaxID=135621 RepID=UPI0024489C78|nr:hypothetical protein [Pseudomonas sp. GD04158]MDH0096186.1 hypothetical protein [Pseudomonas sp. GD04158]